MKIDQALQQVLAERERAFGKIEREHGNFFDSDLEGVAAIKAGADDRWDSHRRGFNDTKTKRAEARKVAAAALQYLIDCC